MTETTIQPVKQLKVNGEVMQAKAVYYFDVKAEKYASTDKDGNVTDGFSNLLQDLINKKTKAIYEFWDCALAYKGKNQPKFDDIIEALDKYIDENGTTGLLKGALDVLNNSGFFKEQSGQFWMTMNSGVKMVKEEDKETMKNGLEMMKESYKSIMGELPY